jgi:hypothetical protein
MLSIAGGVSVLHLQVQLPAAHLQSDPQPQLVFPQPDIFVVGKIGFGLVLYVCALVRSVKFVVDVCSMLLGE